MGIAKRGDLTGQQRIAKTIDTLPRRRQPTMDVRRRQPIASRPKPTSPPAPAKTALITDTSHKHARSTRKPITINLTLPSFKKIDRSLIHNAYRRVVNSSRKTKLISGVMIAVVLTTPSGYHWMSSTSTTTATDPNAVEAKPDLVQGTPKYAVMFPEGRSIKSYEGSTWVNPPDRTPVFVYIDTIESTPINISQQPLPEEFKADPTAKIAQVAASLKTNEKITIDNTAIHLGTSDNGAQSVLFHKNNLLISMTSKTKLATDKWVTYIKSLQ